MSAAVCGLAAVGVTAPPDTPAGGGGRGEIMRVSICTGIGILTLEFLGGIYDVYFPEFGISFGLFTSGLILGILYYTIHTYIFIYSGCYTSRRCK